MENRSLRRASNLGRVHFGRLDGADLVEADGPEVAPRSARSIHSVSRLAEIAITCSMIAAGMAKTATQNHLRHLPA